MKKLFAILLSVLAIAPIVRADEPELQQIIEKADTVIVGNDPTLRKVVVGEDTVDIIIPEKNYGRYDRGLFNYLFVPKRQWSFGLTVSYGELSTEDLKLFDILGNLDLKGSAFSFKPYVSYFFKNNASIGMRLGYVRNSLDLGSMNVDFDDDINFSLKDIAYSNESYSASVFYRHYIGLDDSKRFGIFNEIDLAFSSGNGKFVRPFDGSPRDTRTKTVEAQLNFSPGVCVFIMDNVSFNVSFGVFGVYLRNAKQITNGVDEGSRFASGANFKFNLFNLNFGMAVHI